MQIVKRSGEVVDFDADKIRNVLLKAFKANNQELPEATLNEIVYSVVQEVRDRFQAFVPNVENVQDIVEKKLMEHGYYEIAKSYILYRKERAEAREQKKLEDLKKLAQRKLMVIKSNGERESFNEAKIRRTLL